MTLTGVTCLVKEVVARTPFPLLMGILGASILSPLPFLLVSMKRWISDLGKYGVLFPYVWAACFIVLILATLLDKNASVVPDNSRGLFSCIVMVGVTMCFSLATYCGAFLLLGFLEAISHRFRRFFFLWILAFVIITLSVYIIQMVEGEEGGGRVWGYDLFGWSKQWKSWEGNCSNDNSVSDCDDICSCPRLSENEEFVVDMRKCKTPAIH